MEFIIGSDESFNFESKGFVEFNGIFKESELEKLQTSLEKALKKRFNTPRENFFQYKPKDWYLQGRDLWRESDDVKKILFKSKIGKIAADLVHTKPLRLACDQWIFGGEPLPLKGSLTSSFPFQGTVLGAMITLKNPFPEDKKPPDSLFFPQTPGHIVFFHGDLPFDFEKGFEAPASCSYLLIVITDVRGIYMLQENDPATHHLKTLGYGFGDRLTDFDHPFLIR